MTKYEADDAAAISKRMEEIRAERWRNIQGKPIEAPADIDWTGWNMYSAPSDDTA